MSTSLTITCDPISPSNVADPIERATWSNISIKIGNRTVTQLIDKSSEEVGPAICVPAISIAEWIVSNWWALLNEPNRTEKVPGRSSALLHLPWIQRHCLRSADSALLLPALYIYHDGQSIVATWQQDDAGTLSHMPGEFIGYGTACLSKDDVTQSLSDLIRSVLHRIRDLDSYRVQSLRENWHAISSSTHDESRFCVAVGSMGLNPYDSSEVSEELASFVETSFGDPEEPVNRDLTEIATAGTVESQWNWVQETSKAYKLGPMQGAVHFLPTSVSEEMPHEFGYKIASDLRARANLSTSNVVGPIEKFVNEILDAEFNVINHDHLIGNEIRAAVGWSGMHQVTVAGPEPQREDSKRFLMARSLFHAICSCEKSQRLVTGACTWQQRASRAFAAEFLAPRLALIDETGDRTDPDTVDRLASRFAVSRAVIERQLENANVTILEE